MIRQKAGPLPQDLWYKITVAIAFTFTVSFAVGFVLGQLSEKGENYREGKVNFDEALSNSRIKQFCKDRGYESGWLGCTKQEASVTCYKTSFEGWEKYDCFKIIDVLSD